MSNEEEEEEEVQSQRHQEEYTEEAQTQSVFNPNDDDEFHSETPEEYRPKPPAALRKNLISNYESKQ